MIDNKNHIVSKEFYKKVLNKAMREAGPKYTPGIEKGAPNLEISELVFAFEILGRTQRFYEYLQSLTDELKNNSNSDYCFSKMSEFKSNITKSRLKRLYENINKLIIRLKVASEKYSLIEDIDFNSIYSISKRCTKTIQDIRSLLYQKRTNEKTSDRDRLEKINNLIDVFREIYKIVDKIKNFCDGTEVRLANIPLLLLLGEAGIGKTHFLCDIAKKRLNEDYPTIIMLGHHFQQFTDLEIQIVKLLTIDISFKEFIQKLNRQALKTKRRCLIIIDAINEGDNKAWKKNLNSFIKQIENYKGLGFVISCRTPFEKIIIPKRPKPKLTRLLHPGFREIEFDAQAVFFKYYKIPTPDVPPLIPEFSNPLFLKLFCKSLEKATIRKKHKQIQEITSGQKGMNYIFEFFIKERGKHIEKSFKLPRNYCWNNVFKKIAEKMAESERGWLSKKELKDLLFIEKSNLFINKLITEGMLLETLEWEEGKRELIESIRFPYQKFSDHIISRYLLEKYLNVSTEKEIEQSIDKDTPLGSFFRKEKNLIRNAGIIEALMIEFPTRIKKKGELFDYLNMEKIPGVLVEAFINGLIWRDPEYINNSTSKSISRILEYDYFKNELLDILVALATKPKHPYNAEKLSRYLKGLEMNKRDLFWSEFLRKQSQHNSIYRVLSWIEMTKAQITKIEYAQMYIIILMWILTSTNRSLRGRATRAIYYLGCKYPDIIFKLTIKNLEINDPYVPERMLAASYGVAMALHNDLNNLNFRKNILPKFAMNLYESMFEKKAPYSTTHILMRDYARHTIEIALLHNGELLKENQKKRIRPPFKDGGIRKWGCEEDRNAREYRDGICPFGTDFNNYTIGRLIPKRGNYDFKNPEYIEVKSNMWWRIYSLGYSLEQFGEIDKQIARNDFTFSRTNNSGKTERYGKKYCWVAFYEIAGYRKDKGLLKEEENEAGKRIYDIDIDPSFPEKPQELKIIEKNYLEGKPKVLTEWIEKGPIPDISDYLNLDKINEIAGPWVLLNGLISQESYDSKRGIFIFLRGFLIKEKDIEKFNRHREKITVEGRSLPEPEEDDYAFEGEIPWCDTFSYTEYPKEIEIPTGKKMQKKVPIIIIKEKVFLKSGEVIKKIGNYSSEELKKGYSEREEEITMKFDVEIPIRSFRYIVKEGRSVYVLSKELSSELDLHIEPQYFNMLDNKCKKASIVLQIGDSWHNGKDLIYLRKDLLKIYLKKKNMQLVWIVWGQREFKSKNNEGLEEFSEKHKHYKVFGPHFSIFKL